MAIKIIKSYHDDFIGADMQTRECRSCGKPFEAHASSPHAKCRDCRLGTTINIRRSPKKK